MAGERKKKETGFLWIFIVLLIAAGAVVLLLPIGRELQKHRQEQKQLKERLALLKEERNRGRMEIHALRTSPAAVEKVAREKYRLVRKGETVMLVTPQEKK